MQPSIRFSALPAFENRNESNGQKENYNGEEKGSGKKEKGEV